MNNIDRCRHCKTHGSLAQATGIKAVHQAYAPKAKNACPEGLVRIDYGDLHYDFAIQAKARVTRAIAAMEKAQPTLPEQDRILVTEYATPPLYIFIKGNKRPENQKPAPIKRLFKPAGLKVIFALLNHPEMVGWPYRQIADRTDVALGTVAPPESPQKGTTNAKTRFYYP